MDKLLLAAKITGWLALALACVAGLVLTLAFIASFMPPVVGIVFVVVGLLFILVLAAVIAEDYA